MFSKIALTLLVIAVVFLLGRVSGMAGGKRQPRVGGRRRWGRPRETKQPPPPMVEDLVECPFCGSHVPATVRCQCRDTTHRN